MRDLPKPLDILRAINFDFTQYQLTQNIRLLPYP